MVALEIVERVPPPRVRKTHERFPARAPARLVALNPVPDRAPAVAVAAERGPFRQIFRAVAEIIATFGTVSVAIFAPVRSVGERVALGAFKRAPDAACVSSTAVALSRPFKSSQILALFAEHIRLPGRA